MYDIVIGRDEEDRKKFGTEGTILLGKHYVKMGQTASLSNNLLLDVNRSHVVFICGKRGCLAGDTKVFTDKGYKKIEEVDISKNSILTFDKKKKVFEWEEDFKLISYDIKGEELYKISLENGQELVLTEEHPLLTFQNKKLAWKIASEINKKDKLVSVNKLSQVLRTKSATYFNNRLFNRKIKEITKVNGTNKVYDLQIRKNHSFIANGVISHNSGKSYSMGVIAEGMSDLPQEVKSNIAVVMLDTMGIYWTMKYPNKKEEALLKEWNLEPKALSVHIYTPKGYYQEYKDQGIPTDFPFSIKPSELEASDWCMSFELDLNSEIGVTIERAINDLKEEKSDYDIDEILKKVNSMDNVKKEVVEAIENRFLSAKKWGLFDKEGTPIQDLVKGGQVTVLDVSCYATIPGASNIRALVIGLVSEKLFLDRMIARKKEEYDSIKKDTSLFEKKEEVKSKEPLVWLILDEAHEFLPNEGQTTATKPLITVLREGRQPGISLILATQQPGKIHSDVMTQSDVVIAHRVTANYDVTALGMLMQSYMREGLDKQLNYLPRVQGAAIVFDDSNEKLYPMRIRPRLTWHGGESPAAIEKKKKMFSF